MNQKKSKVWNEMEKFSFVLVNWLEQQQPNKPNQIKLIFNLIGGSGLFGFVAGCPLHWKSKIFKLRLQHCFIHSFKSKIFISFFQQPAVKPFLFKKWIMAGGPQPFKFNQFSINLSILKEEIDGIDEFDWAGPFNLALQLLNKSISRCSIALLFNN